MQDGYRSNAYLTISVRDNMRLTCEALKAMSSTELTKLWKVCLPSHTGIAQSLCCLINAHYSVLAAISTSECVDCMHRSQ